MDFSVGEFGVSLGYDRVSGTKNSGNHEKGELDSGELSGVVTDNVLTRLPEDPFCVDIMSTLEAAMIGWFYGNPNDLGWDSSQYRNHLGLDSGQYQELDEPILDGVCSDAVMLQQQIVATTKALTDNVLSRLPDDPFCMNFKCTLQTAFSDWFHEHQEDLGLYSDKPSGGDETLFSGLNWVCDGTMMSQHQKGSFTINSILMPYCSSHSCEVNDSSAESDSLLNGKEAGSVVCGPGEPHDAFMFVLPYLRLEDLIKVERVCKSLRDAVRNDPYLWKTIHILLPLSERVTNDTLLKLTHRAEGNLQQLNLECCTEITDDGLMQVLASNPRLTKLSIEGCRRLRPSGILSNLRVLKSSGILGLKSIRTGEGLYFTNEQFEELKFLLRADANAGMNPKMPRIYGACSSEIFLEDGRVIDLEICQWCKKPRLLYDCPLETCQSKDHASPLSSCRSCIFCVERCVGCGRCVNNCEFEELFCLAFLCFACCRKTFGPRPKG